MDNRRYQELRTYCMAELGENMNLPGYDTVMTFAVRQGGDTGRINREEYLARSLFQCHDLTTRERAAAHLLAVITNHRIATWQREPSPPNGQEPAPPLDKSQADELARVTCDAVKRYAAFLPESERLVLLEDCLAAMPILADMPAAKVEAAPNTLPRLATGSNKLRRDILDPAIDKAIKQAGNGELADVYLKLKELALAGELPFTGVIEGSAMCYTDSDDRPSSLTKDALGKRLKRR